MKYLAVLILLFTLSKFLSSQIIQPTKFPNQSSEISNTESFLLGLPDNSMIMIWYDIETGFINTSKSTDNGSSWGNTDQIIDFTTNQPVDISAVVMNSGRILLTFKNSYYRLMYSDDSGESWQGNIPLPTFTGVFQRTFACATSLAKLNNGQVTCVFSYSVLPVPQDTLTSRRIYTIGSYDGINWSSNQLIDSTGRNGNIVSAGVNKEILVYETTDTPISNIVYRTSSDGGLTWSDKNILLSDEYDKFKPRIIQDSSTKLWLLYYRHDPTIFAGYLQSEIYMKTSTDQGISWSQSEKFSNYAGSDELSSLSYWNGQPIVSFNSSREFNLQNEFLQIYYGIPGMSTDFSTPPFLNDFYTIPEFPSANEPITFRAFATDENSLSSVVLKKEVNGVIELLDMFDDGSHNDSLPGDNIYGYVAENGVGSQIVNFDFILTDADNNTSNFSGSTLPNFTTNKSYIIDVNKLKLPLSNKGILAFSMMDSISGLHFEESSVLFSGGFFISGYNQNQLWTNAVASSMLVEDYLPGPVNSDPFDPRNSIYVIKSTDPDFGHSWLVYNYAVQLGADFYDGDGDGIYNPVDLNSNGSWDSNEDRPDFLGDETAWCVFNDALPTNQRRWNTVSPMGIEILQTLFAIGDETNPVDNMIFIRYRIVNTGSVSAQFDSVYFGIWDDPDIGGDYTSPTDDLVGCDSLISLGFSYNDGDDFSYGANPPAFGTQYLAGPVSYIPGETFIDINGNGTYDEGVDTPLDTARVKKGEILGIKVYPGAKNLNASSFIHFMNSIYNIQDPINNIEARNFLLGRDKFGELIDPCNWGQGNVYSIPCDQVNPIFLYSGDPVNNYGWINTDFTDQRVLTSIGPFILKQNEPSDIWVCYLVGRGNSSLESVTTLKQLSTAAIKFYESNFSHLPSNVSDNGFIMPQEYVLNQNYPNPFNPSTTISFQLPTPGNVTLKIFDILGREVATIMNEIKSAGNHRIEFDASKLSSGVYMYQLKAGSFIQTKKMLLLK